MRKMLLLLAVMFLAGLVWFSCSKDNPTAPVKVSNLAGKGTIPQVAIDRVKAIQNEHSQALIHLPGIVGTATTIDANGSPAIVVLTETPNVKGIPAVLDGVPVSVVVSGKIKALARPSRPAPVDPTSRFARPVPIGVSTGHPAVTAGTIGVRVKAGNNVYALSNNHVYADENKAAIGDNVLQPGAYDGGVDPGDAIGALADFEKIDFNVDGVNYIDAAIALSTTGNLGKATPADGYGTPKSSPLEAQVGQKVMKYGRTTKQTTGRVYAVNAVVKIGYDTGTAVFYNQIIITPGTFSAGGDSGSLIVSGDKGANNLKPIGLLFAGSTQITIANPIGPVLARFGVTIDGN
jgi:hypothetical protein